MADCVRAITYAGILEVVAPWLAAAIKSYTSPGKQVVGLELFSESLGYDRNVVDRIGRLEIGESVALNGGDHIVRRIGLVNDRAAAEDGAKGEPA